MHQHAEKTTAVDMGVVLDWANKCGLPPKEGENRLLSRSAKSLSVPTYLGLFAVDGVIKLKNPGLITQSNFKRIGKCFAAARKAGGESLRLRWALFYGSCSNTCKMPY